MSARVRVTRLVCCSAVLVAAAAAQTPAPATAAAPDIAKWVEQLGAADYAARQSASRELLAIGPAAAAQLERAAAETSDPEIRRRLAEILENMQPPQFAALVCRAAAESGLVCGDVITHVAGRRILNVADLRQRLRSEVSPVGAVLRVRRAGGPVDVGPLGVELLDEVVDYAIPHGPVIAHALGDYAAGHAERAYARLAPLASSVPEAELPGRVLARIAYVAGDAAAAQTALQRYTDPGELGDCATGDWLTPSVLDLALPGPAPFDLEWRLCELGTPPAFQRSSDPDLRVQRVLIPARRYREALLAAASIWWGNFRGRTDFEEESERSAAGNQLAVVAWMLHELGLRSESTRLIEPRSVLLRRSPVGARKWVRVDTDAWLDFFAGRAAEAADGFYDDAMDVLLHPAKPLDPSVLVRNPQVAARVSFFLYFSNDRRSTETTAALLEPAHPYLAEYLRWMLHAVHEKNAELVRADLLRALPHLPESLAPEFAAAAARLEYLRPEADPAVWTALRERARSDPARSAHVQSLAALRSANWAEAEQALAALPADEPGAAALAATMRLRRSLPADAPEALRDARLAVPLFADDRAWLILAPDLRIHRYTPGSDLQALAPPGEDWRPQPLTWPWISSATRDGRALLYAPRRVVQLSADGSTDVAVNLAADEIPAFERLAAPFWDELRAAAAELPSPRGFDGEFLPTEVQANSQYTNDPRSPEIALIETLSDDARLVHVALRGPAHLLIDRNSGRTFSSGFIAQQLQLGAALTLQPRALPALSADAPPVLLLLTDKGLIRADLAAGDFSRLPVPGDEPFPALTTEATPYERRDPRYVYFARMPSESAAEAQGAPVFRLGTDTGAIQPLDLVNWSLPEPHYRLRRRGELRLLLSRQLLDRGLVELQEFVADAARVVAAPQKEAP